jgi:hypothetical protein
MSGFVPKRVSSTRTAMGSTDANSTGKNGHSIVSTIGRRSTLLRGIQTRSFGSMWQIDYLNAAGNKCKQEELLPTYSTDAITLPVSVGGLGGEISFKGFRDGNSAGFVTKSLQNKLVTKYGGDTYTDQYCAMGNIAGNVGDNIKLGSLIRSGNPLTLASGRGLIAIKRWMTDGWGFGAFGAGKNGLVIVLEGSNIPAAECPAIRLSDVRGGINLFPYETQYCGIGGNIPNFGGVDIGNFVAILYGGDPGNADQKAVDDDFISGFNIGEEKNFILKFVNY